MTTLCPELAAEEFLPFIGREKKAGHTVRHRGTASASVTSGEASMIPRDLEDAALKRMMIAAQAGDRVAYDTLLRKCLPIIRRMARHHEIGRASCRERV